MGNHGLSGMARAGAVASIALLAACGGGSSAPTYSIGGDATGLASGSEVALQLNGSVTTTLSTNGSFTIGPPLLNGLTYSVTVLTQPADQICNLGSAAGVVTGADVTSITLSCYATFQVLYSFSGGADGRNGGQPEAGLIQGADGDFYGTTPAGPVAGQNATVFKTTSVGEMTVVYNFPVPTQGGYYTVSSLVQGTDGDFYGTTSAVYPAAGDSGLGGNLGTVFRVTPSGVFTLLHIFGASPSDGIGPEAELIQATDGNFYGTTTGGGSAGFGTVFGITPSGVETVLYSFPSSASRPSFGGALIQGLDGNFYCIGGTTLDRIGADGTATAFYAFASPNGPVGTLLQDSSGNFFGLALGGANGTGEIFRVTPSGEESVVYSFSEDLGPLLGLGLAPDGTLYGVSSYVPPTTLTGFPFPSINGTVFAVTPAGVETSLYAFGDSNISTLLRASDGHYYGVTSNGGTYNLGAIIRF